MADKRIQLQDANNNNLFPTINPYPTLTDVIATFPDNINTTTSFTIPADGLYIVTSGSSSGHYGEWYLYTDNDVLLSSVCWASASGNWGSTVMLYLRKGNYKMKMQGSTRTITRLY